jgi:hypothetical protein
VAARKAHKAVHDPCPHGATSWAACEQAAKEARGRCTALTERESECTNWATDEHEGKGYCGQHYGSRVNASLDAARKARKAAEQVERIEAYLAWKVGHPSVWDKMDAEPPAPRRGVLWSARSGRPVPAR